MSSKIKPGASHAGPGSITCYLLLWVGRSLLLISWGNRRHFCVGGQLVAELGFGRQILFLAGQDLRSRAACAAKDRANGCALAAAEQCAQYRAHCRAAAHVDAGALVGAQSA